MLLLKIFTAMSRPFDRRQARQTDWVWPLMC
jgi:hypothetical protein